MGLYLQENEEIGNEGAKVLAGCAQGEREGETLNLLLLDRLNLYGTSTSTAAASASRESSCCAPRSRIGRDSSCFTLNPDSRQ